MARRITVRTTTVTLLVFRDSGAPRCPACGGAMVTLDQGSTLFGVAIESLDRWFDSGEVHRSTPAGFPCLVCLSSLLIFLENHNPA